MVMMFQWVLPPTFEEHKHLSTRDKGWNVINFEKLIDSLHIFVNYEVPINLHFCYWFLQLFLQTGHKHIMKENHTLPKDLGIK